MALVLNKPVLQKFDDPLLKEKQLKAFILRLDKVHDFISGNKLYKLKYNLEAIQKEGKKYLLTFGGAFSNHLAATAQAGKEFNIKTIGIVRGEELNEHSNKYLEFASSCGMALIFVTREKYKQLREDNSMLSSFMSPISSSIFIIPEGGANALGVSGCEEIIEEITVEFDFICVACGTGTTLAGIARSLKRNQRAIGISVLNGENFMKEAVQNFTGQLTNFDVVTDYHFDGFAKTTKTLNEFCKSFSIEKQVPIEPVYTGKLFYGFLDLVKKDFFEKGKTIVLVHTGGTYDFCGYQS